MKYIEQGSLRELLDEVNDWSNLAPKQRHCILVDIAKGMHFLHGREIAHRNLSRQAQICVINDEYLNYV